MEANGTVAKASFMLKAKSAGSGELVSSGDWAFDPRIPLVDRVVLSPTVARGETSGGEVTGLASDGDWRLR